MPTYAAAAATASSRCWRKWREALAAGGPKRYGVSRFDKIAGVSALLLFALAVAAIFGDYLVMRHACVSVNRDRLIAMARHEALKNADRIQGVIGGSRQMIAEAPVARFLDLNDRGDGYEIDFRLNKTTPNLFYIEVSPACGIRLGFPDDPLLKPI